MNPTCGTCKYFKRREVGNIMGACHSRGPSVMFGGMLTDANGQQVRNLRTGQFVPNIDSYWPPVPDTEWCGDHAARPVGDIDLSKLAVEELAE